MVRDTFAASSPGVTINIAPLLSLSADQHSKFMQKRQTPQVFFSLHLDAYRTTSQQKDICALLLGVASHGLLSTSVIVFASAQAFTDNPIYRTMLHSLLNMKLVLVCIDEVHLFVQFGFWFRSEFVCLKSVLFDRLRCGADSEKTHVPVLFLTATCDRDLLLARRHRYAATPTAHLLVAQQSCNGDPRSTSTRYYYYSRYYYY
jgi:superfamily II DNA helicase RecQ